MYELIKLTNKTYYINSPSKVVYHDGYLFDTSNDKEGIKKIIRALDEENLKIKYIINSHSNADHIGGNNYLEKNYNIKSYSTDIESSFNRNPILESSFLYGGYPFKEIRNKFLMAEKSSTQIICELPNIEIIKLPGHFFEMIGFKFDDGVFFLADALMGSDIINKYHITFLYDIKSQFETLDYLETLNGKYFVLSHSIVLNDLGDLIKINRNKMNEIINLILDLCNNKICFDDLLSKIFNNYNLTMDYNQYVLVSSTIKSYLSYLKDNQLVDFIIDDNKMYFLRKKLQQDA